MARPVANATLWLPPRQKYVAFMEKYEYRHEPYEPLKPENFERVAIDEGISVSNGTFSLPEDFKTVELRADGFASVYTPRSYCLHIAIRVYDSNDNIIDTIRFVGETFSCTSPRDITAKKTLPFGSKKISVHFYDAPGYLSTRTVILENFRLTFTP
jgi:hypothetical protein